MRSGAVLLAIACFAVVHGCAQHTGPDTGIALGALDPMAGGVPVRVSIMDSPIVIGGEDTFLVIMLDEAADGDQEVTIGYDLEGDPNADLWRTGFTPQTSRTIDDGQQSVNVKIRTKAGANGIITISVKSTNPANGLAKYTSLQVRP